MTRACNGAAVSILGLGPTATLAITLAFEIEEG